MNNVELRPTIVVGVGGTGTWVLTWLKSMFLDQVGEQFSDIVQLIAFDTDHRLPEVRREDGTIVKLNSPSEFRNIGNVPVPRVLENLHRFPEIEAWLPSNLPIQTVNQGARMVRLLGRMSLFYHFHEINTALSSAVRKIRDLDLAAIYVDEAETNIRYADIQAINVFVVSSLCGGTGSGTFIDIAYLARHFCQSNADHVFVNGYLALPSAFPNVRSQPRLEANAAGCLLDLDYLNQTGDFVEQYPHNIQVKFRERPFNVCYLVESRNRDGKTLSGMENLAPMMANSIFLQIASQVGPATLSRWDNIEAVTEDDDEGRPTAYSGVGCAKLVFPASDVIEACARRLCSDFIKKRLLQTRLTVDEIDDLVTAFAGEQRINRESLMSNLLQSKGRQRRVDVGVTAQALSNARVDEIADMARRTVRSAERRMEEEHQQQMLKNRRELSAALLESVHQHVENLVNDPQHGLNAAIQFVEQLVVMLGDLGRQMSEERDRVQGLLDTDLQRSRDTLAALTQATANRLPIVRNLQIRSAATAYMQASDQMLRNRLTLTQYDLALGILGDLREKVGRQRSVYVTLHDNLAHIQHNLETQEGTGLDIDSEIDILTWPVVNRQDVESFYHRLAPEESQWMTLAVQTCGALSSWLSQEQDSLRKALMSFARGPFVPIRDVNIEEYLFEDSGRETANVWIERVRNRSVPFWRWIRGRGFRSNDPEEIRVFGVPNQEESIFSGYEEPGEELISTNDNHSLSMLRTEHGLPATALTDYAQYERRYEEHNNPGRWRRAAQIPLRLFDPSLRPSKTDELPRALKAFAVGLVFGYIAEQENRSIWYRRPDHELQGEWRLVERLSADMRHAVEQLGRHNDFMEEIEIAASRYRDRYGKSGIQNRAQEYLANAPESTDDLQEFHETLRETIKSWAEIE